MIKAVRLVIFDLDGTLIDAYRAVYRSINYCLRAAGHRSVGSARIKRTVGWGDRHLLATLLGQEKDLEKVLSLYRRHHAEELKRGSKLLPGAKQVLQELKRQGYYTAVASNRPTKFSLIVIKHLHIDRYFDFVLCADKARRPKPYPDILRQILGHFSLTAAQSIYVGDMTIDLEAGRRARMRTVAVTGGSSRRKDLQAHKPWAMVRNVSGVIKILERVKEGKEPLSSRGWRNENNNLTGGSRCVGGSR